MASIINTYDANSTLVYPRTSTDALVFDDSGSQGAKAIADALSKKPENLEIGTIEIVADHKLKTPEVIAGLVEVSTNIYDRGNLVVDGNTNLNNGLNVNIGNVSVKTGGIDVSGNIEVSVGRVKAPKANFDDCSFGPIHIDGNVNKIIVKGDTIFGNGAYNYKLQDLATQTGAERHLSYNDTSLYVTGVASIANSSKTYTDPLVFIKNGTLYTKGLYVGGTADANKIDPTNIVLKQTATNLISSNNEFNFIKADYNNSVAINYRAENNGIGNITKYTFYNGNKMVGGYAEIDAAAYRCRGGSTYLKADPSANGELIVGSNDPSTRTYIQKDRVVVENATGKSTFSMDSIELDSTKRYIKSTGTRLLTGNSSANYTQIYSDANFIGLSVVGANTETILNLLPSKIYIDSPLVDMDSDARVRGDASVDGKLNVVGDILSQASIIGKNIQLQDPYSVGFTTTTLTIQDTTSSLIMASNSLTTVRLSKDVPVGRVFFVVGRQQTSTIGVSGVGSYRGNIILIRVPGTVLVHDETYGNAQVIGVSV